MAVDDSQNHHFVTTHWSVVLAAGQVDTARTLQALEELCRTCWFGWRDSLSNSVRFGTKMVAWPRVDEATRVQVPTAVPHGFAKRDDEGPGEYGFNWWVNGIKPDGKRKFPRAPAGTYRGAGHNNNYCFVIPEWNVVIVRPGPDGSAGDHVWDAFLGKVGESLIP